MIENPEVSKVIYSDYFGKGIKERIIYQDRKILDKQLKVRIYGEDPHGKLKFSVETEIKFGDKIYKRKYNKGGNSFEIETIKRQRKKKKDEKSVLGDSFFVVLEQKDYEDSLLRFVHKIEKEFCLTEDELIEVAHNFIKKDYTWCLFKTQVEISGCVIDGLAFVNQKNHYKNAKIIGFEAKTNKDNYKRLYDQLNAYLSICDKVYLIIEDKKPPIDLPFYVGIIKVDKGNGEVIREAQDIKHSIDIDNIWSTLMKNLNIHIDISVKPKVDLFKFFVDIETIKRKLIWNQFVIGWDHGCSFSGENTAKLTDKEKRFIRSYYILDD